MRKIVTRAYNEFKISEGKQTITKKSRTGRLKNEMDYYHEINGIFPELGRYFADVVDMGSRDVLSDGSFETIGKEHELVLQLYAYENYGKQYIKNLMYRPVHEWENEYIAFLQHLRNRVLPIFHKKIETTQFARDFNADEMVGFSRDMFIHKTEREYFSFVRNFPQLREMFDRSDLHGYKNFIQVWPDVSRYIGETILSPSEVEGHYTVIHGDMCFSNILYGADPYQVVKFIDPRGKFGRKGIWGDNRYDLAKLYHSIEGMYEFIINDEFSLKDGVPEYSIPVGVRETATKEFFDMFTDTKEQRKEIMILSGCIFVGMCARHYDSIDRQLAMYYTGIRQLNEAMEL